MEENVSFSGNLFQLTIVKESSFCGKWQFCLGIIDIPQKSAYNKQRESKNFDST